MPLVDHNTQSCTISCTVISQLCECSVTCYCSLLTLAVHLWYVARWVAVKTFIAVDALC